jgi:hypothetical protein
MPEPRLHHQFVEYIPEQLDPGVLYVTVRFGTVVHTCCCGCGQEVVTPLSPTDWQLTFDGESVSLYPSIGNWSLPCRSHYWIKKNRVVWAPAWSAKEIAAGRAADQHTKQAYYEPKRSTLISPEKTASWWTRLRQRWH